MVTRGRAQKDDAQSQIAWLAQRNSHVQPKAPINESLGGNFSAQWSGTSQCPDGLRV